MTVTPTASSAPISPAKIPAGKVYTHGHRSGVTRGRGLSGIRITDAYLCFHAAGITKAVAGGIKIHTLAEVTDEVAETGSATWSLEWWHGRPGKARAKSHAANGARKSCVHLGEVLSVDPCFTPHARTPQGLNLHVRSSLLNTLEENACSFCP